MPPGPPPASTPPLPTMFPAKSLVKDSCRCAGRATSSLSEPETKVWTIYEVCIAREVERKQQGQRDAQATIRM